MNTEEPQGTPGPAGSAEDRDFNAGATAGADRGDRLADAHLRSEMAQEIISRKPTFVERWALLMFTLLLLLLCAGTWFVQYPDTIDATAVLTSVNGPKELVVRQDGRLHRLFVQNGESVRAGEMLGWMESTADQAEVLDLSRRLDSSQSLINSGRADEVSAVLAKQFDNLGEVQQQYQTFVAALELFNDYAVDGFYEQKRAMLLGDIRALDSANHTIQRQKALTQQDIQLAEQTYAMNRKLFDEKVISQDEFRAAESKLLNKRLEVPQLDASMLSNANDQREKAKEVDQIDHDKAQQDLTFAQALESLKSAVDDWKQKYILLAPTDGRVVFAFPVQENQFLKAGKVIGYVNPGGSQVFAEANLAQENFGKVDTGLRVQLRFEAYPYQEAGVVNGTLSYVSNIPSDSGFLADIRLDKGLVTTNGLEIQYKSGLKAEAVIITRNMRLLQRLWSGLRKDIQK